MRPPGVSLRGSGLSAALHRQRGQRRGTPQLGHRQSGVLPDGGWRQASARQDQHRGAGARHRQERGDLLSRVDQLPGRRRRLSGRPQRHCPGRDRAVGGRRRGCGARGLDGRRGGRSPGGRWRRGCLRGHADAADFDLVLSKWNGKGWVQVAKSEGPSNLETVAAGGSGAYTLTVKVQ